mgnify:FL=1
MAPAARDGARDFDFLFGRWRVHNRRLRQPLTGSGEWDEFDGTSVVRPLWDGRANYEEWEADAPGGRMRAVSLHLYDPESEEWSLHWATRESGRVGVPTVGRFTGARGEFHDQERHDGRAIFIRITWEPRGDRACRFEQSYSADGGRTWETNWIMDFTRDESVATPAPVIADPSHHGNHDFDFLHGSWRVRNRRLRTPLSGSHEWYEFDTRSTEHPLWDGAGNLEELEGTRPDGTPLRGLALRLFDPATHAWSIHWASSARGRLEPPMTGGFTNGLGVFFGYESFEECMIFLRFHWIRVDRDRARWEQAFSHDGGATWETNWVMDFTRAPERAHHSAIVELRRYVLHPGARDTLIALFERELMEPQEAAGMLLIAQYRDIDDPNTFTWLRGFPNMAARATALTTFYDGPAWARHRDAANATMVSSDDVRMLHPVSRSPLTSRTARLTVATIYTLTDDAAPGFAARFAHAILPRLAASGMHPFALFETEHSDNTFPRLPVREHEHAFVWLAQFDELDAYDRCAAALAADPRWRDDIRLALDRQLAAPPLVWRLTPTSRSPERW